MNNMIDLKYQKLFHIHVISRTHKNTYMFINMFNVTQNCVSTNIYQEQLPECVTVVCFFIKCMPAVVFLESKET